MDNMLDTTSSPEGVRAFMLIRCVLVRLFCLPHNNPFASFVPGTTNLQLQCRGCSGSVALLGWCPAALGNTGVFSLPHSPIPAWVILVLGSTK